LSARQAGTLVYSTEEGRICPACSKPVAQCSCRTQGSIPVSDGVVRISLETKGRRGKGVTVIKGIPLNALELTALAKQLKTTCGSGGTAKDGLIEIQGDHRDLIEQKLSARWVVKRSGGR